MSLDESGELLEPNTAEQDSQFPADPECSSVEAQLIASQLCLCTQKTQLYVSAEEDGMIIITIYKIMLLNLLILQTCIVWQLIVLETG